MKGLIFILILICFIGYGQDTKRLDSLAIESPETITDFGSDDFNNLYYIRNYSEIIKIGFPDKSIKTYSNQTILEELNTQNVLQITLKSSLFNLLVLDNQLNPVQDIIEFPIETNFTPTLTSLVDNNYLWGYDPVLQRLVLWNYREKKAIRQSVILSEKTGDEFYAKILYHQNKIYLVGFSKILKFDEYANLEAVIPFQEFDQICIRESQIYFSHEKQLYQLDLNSKTTSKLEAYQNFDYFSINNRYLFVLKGKVVYLYDFHK